MRRVDLTQVLELQNQGAQLLEVLPKKEFDERHIPGAINLPLSKFQPSELSKLNKNRPIVVYCWDYK